MLNLYITGMASFAEGWSWASNG